MSKIFTVWWWKMQWFQFSNHPPPNHSLTVYNYNLLLGLSKFVIGSFVRPSKSPACSRTQLSFLLSSNPEAQNHHCISSHKTWVWSLAWSAVMLIWRKCVCVCVWELYRNTFHMTDGGQIGCQSKRVHRHYIASWHQWPQRAVSRIVSLCQQFYVWKASKSS